MLLQFTDAFNGNFQPFLALERERPGDHCHRQNTHFTRHFGNYRCPTGTGTTTHTRGDKYHIGTAQCFGDPVPVFERGSAADVRVGTGTEPLGNLTTKLQDRFRLDVRQGLGISIGADKIHTLDRVFDHVFDRVAAASPDAYYLDDGIFRNVIDQFKHGVSPLL
jgi:hypothetical protein